MNDFEKINEQAIQYLYKDNYRKAYELFEINKRINPNYVTFNNYAVNLLYDDEIVKVKSCIARQKGKKYLKKAIRMKPNYQSYIALGGVYYEESKYLKSLECHKKALEYLEDRDLIGCTYFHMSENYLLLKRYKEAYTCIKKVNILFWNEEDKEIYYFLLADILYYYQNLKELEELFKYLCSIMELSPQLINIAFMLKKYNYIVDNCFELVKIWNLEFFTLHQILFSIKQLSTQETLVQFINNFKENNESVSPKVLMKIDRLLRLNVYPKLFVPRFSRLYIICYL